MNANPEFLNLSAHVDEAAVKPLPNSRKIYVQGSRPDIRVPMREISQSDTPANFGAEKNPPIFVYDTSGPYTDPAVKIDIRAGLPSVRGAWIEERGDTETTARADFGIRPATPGLIPALAELRFNLQRKPRRAKAGMNVTPDALCAQGHHHAGNGIHRHPRKPAPRQPARTVYHASIRATVSAPRSRTSSRRNSCATKWRAAAPSSRPTSTIPNSSR